MARPTAEDPLGQLPDPNSFDDMMAQLIDKRIDERWRGKTRPTFDGIPTYELAMELIARGWVVYKPETR